MSPSRLFAPPKHPYYISAPHFQQGSGGVRALHYLCHALNLLGEEAYVTTPDINPSLRTPTLTPDVFKRHEGIGLRPIAIYPEVVSGNPLHAQHIVRYLLAEPALHTGQPIQLGARDLIYTFGPTLVPKGWAADPLRIPLVDTRVFNSEGVNDAERRGSAVFIHRHLNKGGPLHPITADSIEISYRVEERSAQELAEIFRQVECLYLYEYSTICFEALLCGCPVVFIKNDVSLKEATPWLMGGHGIAWDLSSEALAHAKATVAKAKCFYEEEERQFWLDLQAFVKKTQAHAGPPEQVSVGPTGNTTPATSVAKRTSMPPHMQRHKRRLVICGIETPQNACPSIRLFAPFSFFSEEWELVWAIVNGELRLDTLRSADVILLHRFMPGVTPPDVLKGIFELGKPVIYETDDLLTEIPDGLPNADFMRRGKPGVESAIRQATAVVVSTPYIAEKYRPLNPNIHVLPNFIDFERFYRWVPMQASSTVKIGLVGSSLMQYNFALVDAALRRLCERYPGQIRLCFIGHDVPSGWSGHPAVEFQPVLHEYQAYRDWLMSRELDIALVPLVEDEFNNSKSVIKWMEYSAAGVVSVFSDVSTYRAVVDSGRNGILIENNPEAWFESVDQLIANPALRRQLARTAQAEVRKHFALRENAWRYHQTYLRAIGAIAQAEAIQASESERVPGVLVLDGTGEREKVDASLARLEGSPYKHLPVIVLTTSSGTLPEWTDSLRFVQASMEEYPETVEQLCALGDFDWALIIEAGQ